MGSRCREPRRAAERRSMTAVTVRLEPLDPARHGDDLFACGRRPGGRRTVGDLATARFRTEPLLRAGSPKRPPARIRCSSPRSTRRAAGPGGGSPSWRIEPRNGVIEVGHILFGPRLAATRAATEAIYLLARVYVFDDLGYRRFEWKCNNRNEPSNAPRCATASPSKACFASIWWSRARIATRPGSRSSTMSGRRAGRRSNAGWRRTISTTLAGSARA